MFSEITLYNLINVLIFYAYNIHCLLDRRVGSILENWQALAMDHIKIFYIF